MVIRWPVAVCVALMFLSFTPARGAVTARVGTAAPAAGPQPYEIAPAYLCGRCTDAAYEETSRRLGPGRHLLFDLAADAPRVYRVPAADSGAALEQEAPTDAERRRFDLSRRFGAGAGPWKVAAADLSDLLRPRKVARTTAMLAATGALRNDFINALDALVPVSPPDVASLPCAMPPCMQVVVKDVPVGRDVTIILDDGGSVAMRWSGQGEPVVREIRDARGNAMPVDDNNDFTHGKVYIFGDRASMEKFRKYLREIGFKVDVPDTADSIRCIKAEQDIDCSDGGDWIRSHSL